MIIFISGGNGNIARIIKKKINNSYKIYAPSRIELDILDYNKVFNYINDINPDIVIHTAIIGGRRTNEETSDVFYKNILMFENIIKSCNRAKIIINLDSGAIYDRQTDIMNRKEQELYSVPQDYYGLSKYIIYQRSQQYNNIYNFRIFNIFHIGEENNRFIKACFDAKKNNTPLIINEDKYFDFVYEDDFIKILKYYLENIDKQLDKTINICYNKKYKLSDIVQIIENIGEYKKINVEILKNSDKNYCGNSQLIYSLLELDGLETSLLKYYNSYYNL